MVINSNYKDEVEHYDVLRKDKMGEMLGMCNYDILTNGNKVSTPIKEKSHARCNVFIF